MVKLFLYILTCLFIFTIFFAPVRGYINHLLYRDKWGEPEYQIIGKVSGYNPRVVEIQKVLKEAGFDPGVIDGTMGAQTRLAIRNFQKDKKLKPTGRIDAATHLALTREKESGNNIPIIKIEVPLTALKDKSASANEGGSHTVDKIESREAVKSHNPESNNRSKQIQIALKNTGFYKGEVDGRIGPRTKTAIRAFQKANKIKVDGVVGPKTWAELNKFLFD
ncbi:MAG: peptidoglycan-binding protein [Candidatus Omnitrophota bacterium]|jgi:peptidoglycan hydrolase-like protein with peptidoglycan-binding domain|nr:MAG: peptidoglycan-binding protein [Candidatus Omnitrophota bacterium]